jgi:hypothetical protein
MSFGRLATRAIIAGAFALLTAGHPRVARADVETCGAHLLPMVALSPQPAGAATTYAFVLRADTPRSVQGQIVADTSSGWFAWNFPMTQMTLQPSQMLVRGWYAMTGKSYETQALYVSFPTGTVVRHAWVEHAQTSGETVFGLDARGNATCSVPDFGDDDPYQAPPVPPTLTTGSSVVAAKPTDARFTPTCEAPFAKSDFSDVPRMEPPQEFSGVMHGTTVVAIAIDNTGKVLDSWPLSSSGNIKWDMTATIALRGAKYRPPVTYCLPVAATLYLVMRYGQ